MTLILNGDTGLSDVDGSAATPAIRGTDSNTGIFFPAADTIAFAEGGVEVMRIDSSGDLGIGTSSPSQELHVYRDQNATTEVLIENPNAGTSARTQLELSPEVGSAFFTANSSTSTVSAIAGGALGAGLYTSSDLTNGLSVGTIAGPLKFFAGSSAAERARITASGDFQFNSGYGSVATAYGCRAWVNFNGTGTVAIRASGNVTSITDNGTGDYTVNFTTAMPDANYGISFAGDVNTGVSANDTRAVNFGAPATGSIRIFTGNNYASPIGEDWALICLSVFR
jgi:hypothetical protein